MMSTASYKFAQVMWNISNKSKYAKWYLGIVLNIINRGHLSKKVAKLELGYVEGHHIIPVSFDKSNSKTRENIIFCTAREHFLIHLLMTKMFSSKKLTGFSKSAIRGFSMKNTHQRRKVNSRFFETIRQACLDTARGNTNGSKTKGYLFYTNGDEYMTLPPDQPPPMGWYRGGPGVDRTTITNGKENRKIPKNTEIPDGWWVGSSIKGRPSKLKGRKRAPRKDECEANRQISESQKLKIWITDGKTNLRLNKWENIPEGWRRGRVGVKFPQCICPNCNITIDIGNFKRHVNACRRDNGSREG